MKLTYKPGDNKMKITVKGSESSFTDSITFGPKGGIAGKATISVKIVPDTLGSSFAFQEVNLFPPDSLSVHSRVFTKMPKAVEPFYFVNNIHYPTDSAIEVVELSTGDTQRIEPNELGSLLIQVAKDVRNAETPTFAETTYGGYKLRMDSSDIGKRSTTSENLVGIPASLNNLLNYDVIGDSGKRTGTNIEARQQCSYEYFCPQEDFKTAADDVTKNINEEWKRVHSYLTKVTPTKMSLRSDFELGLEAFLVGAFETSLEMNADPEYSQCYGTSLSQGLFGACQAMFKSNQYPPSATLWEFLRTGARVACQIELFDFVIKARSQADLYMAKYCMGNYFQGFYTPGVFQQPWPQYGQPPYYSGPGTFQGCMWGGSPYGGGDIFTKYAGEECSFFIERAPWTTASFKWVLKKAGAGGGIKVLDYEIGGKEHNEASLVLKDAGGTSFPSANGFPYVDYTGSVVKYDDHAPKLYTMNKYGFRPYKTEDKTGDQLDVVTDIKKLVPGIGKLTDGTVLVSSNLLSATDPSLDEEKRALVIGISMNVLDQTSPLLKVETMEQLESVSEELVQYLIDEKYSGLPNLKQLLSSSGLEGYTDCKMDVNEKSIVVKCKPPPQPSNGITVTLSADQLTVQKQGDPTTLTVTINKEGLPTPYQPPEAVSYYISQQEISGSYPVKEFKPASVLQGTFHFTHNLAEAGTYRVVVKIGANDEYASNTVTLNIASQPSPPRFSLTVSPDIIYREDLQPPKNVGISISILKPPDTSAYEVSMAIKDGHDAYTNYVPGLPKAQIMPLPVHADYPWTVDKNVPVGAYNVKLFAKYPGIKPVKYSLK
ncbi:hypothetical protein HZC09_04015, partial [Candidatus Micrarchaeota archaeon]|nr:hypothetical protein [Candidatus Micrarchaeota archaeon]